MLYLPAEWEKQEFIQLVFPHQKTDWNEYLDEAINTFVTIAKTIAKYQKCLIVAQNLHSIKSLFPNKKNLIFVKIDSDDTWSRDFGGITINNNVRQIGVNAKTPIDRKLFILQISYKTMFGLKFGLNIYYFTENVTPL